MGNINPFEPPIILTKDFILSRVSPEEIFHKYLGFYPELNTRYTNPKRSNDDHPDCNFYIDGRGVLKFVDYAGGFNWDCFNVVEYEFKTDFKGALKIIAEDFNLVSSTTRILEKRTDIITNHRKVEVGIRVQRREWSKDDLKWWSQFHITLETLKEYNVSPVSDVWLIYDNDENSLRKVYYHKASDPAYVYHFGGYEYKVYFPLRQRGRFMQTAGVVVQGLQQLPEKGGKNLLITKSLKDVMSLRRFRDEFELNSIAPSSETVVLTLDLFTNLYNSYEEIATLFDFDRTGIRLMRKYQKEYRLPFFFFGAKYKKSLFVKIPQSIKDFSDYIKQMGVSKTRELIQETYDYYRG